MKWYRSPVFYFHTLPTALKLYRTHAVFMTAFIIWLLRDMWTFFQANHATLTSEGIWAFNGLALTAFGIFSLALQGFINPHPTDPVTTIPSIRPDPPTGPAPRPNNVTPLSPRPRGANDD